MEVNTINVVTLAYLGDSVYEVYIREFLINKGYEIITITEDKLSTSLGLTSMSKTKKSICNKPILLIVVSK